LHQDYVCEVTALDVELLADALAGLDELIVLRRRWNDEQGRTARQGDPFEHEFAAWVSREVAARRFWIARVDGLAVGMVNLLLFDRMPMQGGPAGGWGYLCNMYVDQDHRNGGIGAVLASALLAYADELGLERVVLSPTERSRPFYASLGFAPGNDQLLVRRRE